MSYEYDRYLHQHKNNVKRGFEWLQRNLPNILVGQPDASWQIIFDHDSSKNNDDEYKAYDAYFYGNNCSYEVVEEFKRAWLRHIHRNPHHWQHWVLNNDDPDEGEIILDMPYNYIIEMICDWWSFSWQKGDLGDIFNWYYEHSDYIKLSPKTRKTVEDILEQLRERLGLNTLAHHGIKGQKWGVKNGPPYPLDKHQKRDTIVEEAIKSGEVSSKINREKQLRHTKTYHTPGRSYLDGDLDFAQELVNEHGGKGRPIYDGNGNWTHQERVTAEKIIGTHVNKNTLEETKTDKAIITYSKTGTHIYPAQERKDKK